MPPDLNEVRRWLEKADHDRGGAEAAIERNPPITDVAAFHCQQAVEKLLKGYLLFRGQPFEKTHDLVELLALCTQYDDAFSLLRASVEPLTPYAVRFRYPGPADPSVAEVNVAMQAVQTVWKFVNDRLPAQTRL